MISFLRKLVGFSQPAAEPKTAPEAKPLDDAKAFVVTSQSTNQFAVVIDSYGNFGPGTTFGWTPDKSRATVLTGPQAQQLERAVLSEDRVFQDLFPNHKPGVFTILDLRAAQK